MGKNILDYTNEEYQQLVANIVKNGSAVLHDQTLTSCLRAHASLPYA